MENKKEIMIFFDLEGTLIEEELGDVNVEKINGVLESISKLEEITDSKVNLHVVSPVSIKDMKQIVDKLDRLIMRYNRANNKDLKEFQGAVAYPDTEYVDNNYLYDVIIPMEISPLADIGEKDRNGKFYYVRNWVESLEDRIAFSIYAGNGYNDTKAMEYVKSKKGFVICPENSHSTVKELADYVSEKHAADGIKEGFDVINKQIEKRKQKEKEGTTQSDGEGEEIGID